MSNSKPTYEDLLIENDKLRKLVSEKTMIDSSLINSQTTLPHASDIGSLDLADIIDSEALQSLMEQFYKVVPVASAIGNLSGKALASVGWQDICTKFHRCHPETAKNCRESDTILAGSVPFGTFKPYRCKNNMWDMAAPIEIAGRHFGNIFIGQFFYTDDEPDINQFRQKALQYGFDETEYLAALRRVPRLTRENADAAMAFYSELTKLISNMSLSTIKLAKTLHERKQMEVELMEAKGNAEKSENYLSNIINNIGYPVFVKDAESRLLLINDAFCSLFDLSRDQMIGKTLAEELPPGELESFLSIDKEVLETGKENINEESFSVIGKQAKLISTTKSRFIDFNGEKYLIGISHDITEQKQTEAELKASFIRERLMADIVRESVVGIAIGYPDGRLGLCNTAYQHITGYSEEELKTIDWNAVLTPPEWEESEWVKLQELHRTKKAVKYEKEYIRKDGSRVPVELIVNPQFDADGVVEYYFAFVSDITERMQAEEKNRASEENLKETFDISPSIICKANVDSGCFIEVNQAVTRILGYAIEEFKSKLIVDFIHPDDRQRTLDKGSEQLEGQEVAFFENRYLCKDGSYKWMSWYTTKVNENNIVTAIATDITERKKTEEVLNQSTQLLKASQSIAKLGGWELDIESNNLYWTAETYRIHETSPEEFDPTVDAVVGFFLPESRRMISNALEVAIKDGKGYDLELETYTTKGRRIDIRTTCEVILLDGKPTKLIGIFQDITERKQADSDLYASEEKLRQFVDQSNDAILINNKNGDILEWNKAQEKLTGISKKEAESYKLWDIQLQLATPEYKSELTVAIIKKQIEALINKSGSSSFTVEAGIVDRKGHTKFIQQNTFKIILKDEILLASITRDITEGKENENVLRINEEKLNIIINSSPVGICTVDMLGNFITTNQAYERIVGYAKEELVGLSFFDVTHQNDRPKNKKLFQDMFSLETSDFSMEKRYICKNGQEMKVSVHAIAVRDAAGKVIYGTAFIEDITERKLAEQAISLSNDRYKSLFNDSPIPLWEEDFTEVSSYLLELKEKGHKDLRNYFDTNPNELIKCSGMVKVLDVNQATLDLHRAANKEQLIRNLSEIFTENSFAIFKEELIALVEGKEMFECESEVKTLSGDLRHIHLTLKIDQSQPDKVIALLATSDITDRKQAEELLLRNKNRLEYALNSMETGAWELDLKTLGLWRTLKHDQIFGHNEPLDEWTYDMFLEQVIPEDREIVNQKFQQAVATKTDWNFECRIKRNNDGEIRWIWANGNHELKEHEDSVKMFGIVQDITERKQADIDIKESEEKYRSLIDDVLDTSSVGIFILDSEFKVAWINKATEEYFGIKRENVIGKDKKQLINSEIKGIFEDPKYFTKKVLDTYKDNNYIESFECHITTGKDREERWLSHWSQPITEGLYKNGRIEQYTDITDRKRAEEKKIAAEENLKNTFDLSPSIICKANLDTGYFIEVNQAVSKTLGYTVEEFRSIPFMELIHPDDQQKSTDEKVEQLKGKEVTFFENRYLCKDGSYKWMAWNGTKADENGIVTSIGSDIDERKTAEQELARHRNNLEDLVQERTQELETKNKELERFNDLFVDREFRIKELKDQLEKLKNVE